MWTALSVLTDYSPPPDQYAKAVAYSSATYFHFFVNALCGFLLLLLVLELRLGTRYRDRAERASGRRFVQTLIHAPLLLLTVALLGLPSDIWDQSLARSFGLSVQGWPSWSQDWAIGHLIGILFGTLMVFILYGVIRRSPRRYWFYFWLASIPLLVTVFFLKPLLIDPLFFKFEPLQATQPALVAQIEQVVQRGGMSIPRERMYEMNASAKETELNAYVTGFGASKRVVVWDTTIAKATIPETLFVFGHEMGHYVLGHIPKLVTIVLAFLLVIFFLGSRLVQWMLARRGTAWGIRGLDDQASLPALVLAVSALAFLFTPAFNAVSRYFEHEADRYGLEVIHGLVPDSGQVAARYFEKSGEIQLSDPRPGAFVKAWFFDHPTRPERVRFAATYAPWSSGEQPTYVR